MKYRTAAVAGLMLLSCASAPKTYRAKVLKVVDGDTLLVRANKEEISIRLHGIDAPESDQPHGDVAATALESLVSAGRVTVTLITKDHYGRTIAKVRVRGNADVSKALVHAGHAWALSKDLKQAEVDARAAGAGIWSDPLAITPAEWRKR